MRFYTVTNTYIHFLKEFEKKVPNPSGGNYKNIKPYVGVVLNIDGHKFLAPLTSYKEETHDKLPESAPTHFKLYEVGNPGNKLGLIALRYMIPVLDSEIKEVDLDTQVEPYKQMLQRQYAYIKANQAKIEALAGKLYQKVVIDKTPHYVNLSCDIPKLLNEYKNYK